MTLSILQAPISGAMSGVARAACVQALSSWLRPPYWLCVRKLNAGQQRLQGRNAW